MIRLNDKYRVTANNLNYILEENKPVQDPESPNYLAENWFTEGYFPNMKYLLKALLEKEVKETDLVDLQTVLDKIEEVKTLIDEYYEKGK